MTFDLYGTAASTTPATKAKPTTTRTRGDVLMPKQLAFDFDNPIADIGTIVADELARTAIVVGVVHHRFSILVRARWDREDWLVDINPRRVMCRLHDSSRWSVHPTAAYAGLFEAGA